MFINSNNGENSSGSIIEVFKWKQKTKTNKKQQQKIIANVTKKQMHPQRLRK